jgi:serine/threonine protein kinase
MNGEYDASMQDEGYGFETDWWSLGSVIYELAVGVAPFFAPDIKQTYSLIVDHEVDISHQLSTQPFG